MNNFYVYEHWRPDTNQCFYVGKGKNKRAWDLKNMRNRHFKAVISKLLSLGLSVNVKIVISDISEETAYTVEMDRIKFYGIDNLTNMTSGGDGLKNPSQETRQKISKSQKERFKKPEELQKCSLRSKGRMVSEETRKKLSISSTGRKHMPETIEKMKVIAKIRGFSKEARIAQKLAVTGKKRSPFSEETKTKMAIAAKMREENKRKKLMEA